MPRNQGRRVGCDPAELQREMRQAQERQFDRKGANDPASATMFGTIQELITDAYHGAVAFTLKSYAPLAAHGIFLVKKREKLHTEWYRKMTGIQLEHNPDLLANAAFISAHFEMPEKQVAPHYVCEVGAGALRLGFWTAVMAFHDRDRHAHCLVPVDHQVAERRSADDAEQVTLGRVLPVSEVNPPEALGDPVGRHDLHKLVHNCAWPLKLFDIRGRLIDGELEMRVGRPPEHTGRGEARRLQVTDETLPEQQGQADTMP